MIIEHAEFTIAPENAAAFEEAFARGHQHIAKSPGYLWGRLVRQVENPGTYLLLVGWETLESHMAGFRESDLFPLWRAEVGPFFAAPPTVTHFEGDLIVDSAA